MNPSQRPRKRDQLLSFVQSKTNTLRQEMNRYYENNGSSRSLSSTSLPQVQRSETQEFDAILQDDTPEVVQPQCMLFPTYACRVEPKGSHYRVILAGWAFTKPTSNRLNRWLLAAGRTYGRVTRNSAEDDHFSALLNQFRSQTMRMTDIRLQLPDIIADSILHRQHHLSLNQQEKIRDMAAAVVNTGNTGRFYQEIQLDLAHQTPSILTVEACFADHASTFSGFIDIIDPYGISIISDIDDTIKITDILDGKDAILQNTFFRTARQVPHMNEVYQAWAAEGAHVHYVSNSPWQVYPALAEFINQHAFPQGSMHLRAVSTGELIRGKPGKHKLQVIPRILRDFPHRKFILVGDSGEIDPEIYQHIYHEFPDQIIKIFIHDVTSERAMHADQTARNTDSYYASLRKFLSRESLLRKEPSNSQLAMDAMAQTEVPEEQANVSDPAVPLLTKLEQFEARMKRVSEGMREGVFTVFTLATQLMLDPVVAEEFLMNHVTE